MNLHENAVNQGRFVQSSNSLSTITRSLGLVLFVFLAGANAQDDHKYKFLISPLEIYDQFVELKIDDAPKFDEYERAILDKRWNANRDKNATAAVDTKELLEAIIFASGTASTSKRIELRRVYQELLERNKSLQSLNARKRAETLLIELHKTAMKGGYDLDCTTLEELFSDGKYNCVSSTALYYLLGTDLGLKLQPISIPGTEYQAGHATLDLIDDNKRVQIEPTNAEGYDWEVKLAQPGVISLNFGPPRSSGHDVDAWELPCMIYSNRAIKLKLEKLPPSGELLRSYVAALCLGPKAPTPNQNLAALLINWGPYLNESKRPDDAIRIMEFAHQIAPHDKSIENNRRIMWVKKILELLAEKRDDEVVQTVIQAAKAFPSDSEFKKVSRWFESDANKVFESGSLDDGLAVISRALKVVPSAEHDQLINIRTTLVRLQSQRELKRNDVDASLNTLLRFDPQPSDSEMAAAVFLHVQEALRITYEKGGDELTLYHIAILNQKLPQFEKMQLQFHQFATLSIQKLVDNKAFDEAFALAKTWEPAFKDETALQQLRAFTRVIWVKKILTLLDEKRDDDVVQTVIQAAETFPNDSDFTKVTRWFESDANKVFESGSLDDGLAVISRALKVVPSAEHDQLINVRATLLRLQSQRELKRNDVDASLTTLLRFDPQPSDSEMAAAVVYHVQEALPITYEKGGIERTLSHIALLNQKLSKFEKMQLQFHQFATLSIQKLVENKEFDQAFPLAKRWQPVFKDETAEQKLRAYIYIQWGVHLEKQNSFDLAYEKLIEGMKDCPKNEDLAAYAENCVARWGGETIERKKWDEAISIYQLGLKTFPKSNVLSQNLDYCKQEKNR